MIDGTRIWVEGDAPFMIVGSAVALYAMLVRCIRSSGCAAF
jgi:hypothetical protein